MMFLTFLVCLTLAASGNEAAVSGISGRCRVPKGRAYNLPRESGKCDRGKDYGAWDSCNYCVRGSRWVGVWKMGNHWCCTEADLQYGDCECTVHKSEATDESAVGTWGCSDEEKARGCKGYTYASKSILQEPECICPVCMDGIADGLKFDSYAQSTRVKCQTLAFDYGGSSYAWGFGDGCYTYAGIVDVKTAKATSGQGKWVTCSPPKVSPDAHPNHAEGALAYTTSQPRYSWITYGLAAVGVGAVLYGAGSFYLKA